MSLSTSFCRLRGWNTAFEKSVRSPSEVSQTSCKKDASVATRKRITQNLSALHPTHLKTTLELEWPFSFPWFLRWRKLLYPSKYPKVFLYDYIGSVQKMSYDEGQIPQNNIWLPKVFDTISKKILDLLRWHLPSIWKYQLNKVNICPVVAFSWFLIDK